MTTSTLTRRDGTPYKVGDVLDTYAKLLEFAEACGWQIVYYTHNAERFIHSGCYEVYNEHLKKDFNLVYTIVGFHPDHIAKPAEVEPVKQGIPPFSFPEYAHDEPFNYYFADAYTAMIAHYNKYIVGGG
jgi:hypothetical protein